MELHPGKHGDGREPLEPPGQGEDLYQLLRYSHIFASTVTEILETRLIKEASPHPITNSQFNMLKVMALNGQHQVGELAEFLGVSPPSATRNIDKLERLGLVIREGHKGDRRVTLLSASPKGRELVRRYEAIKQDRVAPVAEIFEPEELREFSRMLRRFSVTLLSQEETKRGVCVRCNAYIETNCPVGHVRGGCPYEELQERSAPLGTHEARKSR